MARKSRRRKKEQIETGGGDWLTTFSDLMSLLLTFFILLFSMSNVSADKFSAASHSMQQAFVGTVGGGGNGILDGEVITNDPSNSNNMGSNNGIPQEVVKMYQQAMKLIEKEGIEDEVTVSSDQRGIYLDIQESILFQSGRADITKSGEETLDALIGVLELTKNDIVIEGYTDDVPMRTPRFPSNWELSTARALSVVHYLAEEKGINPSRLSAKGYGEYSPIVPNDSPENRAKNRRVNIVLVYQPEEEDE